LALVDPAPAGVITLLGTEADSVSVGTHFYILRGLQTAILQRGQ
jgi:hypothetical protein